jgi:hypothetical protein
MVQVSFLLLTALTALASLSAVFLFAIGVGALLAGRVTVCTDCVEGRAARVIGGIFAVVLPLVVVLVALFGGPRGVEWHTSAERFVIPVLSTALVLGAIIGSIRYARTRSVA